ERGNSLFLDEQFSPYPDQWAHLSSATRITRSQVEALVREAESKGRILGVRTATADDDEDASPWAMPPSRRSKEPAIVGPLPKTLEVVIGDQIYIAKAELVPGLRNRLIRI